MKYLKTYEDKKFLKELKPDTYVIWIDDSGIPGILEIVDNKDTDMSKKDNKNAIWVKPLYYLENDTIKKSVFNNTTWIDKRIPSDIECIKYVSKNLEECKELLPKFVDINKYNL